jgi:hypothetical protein
MLPASVERSGGRLDAEVLFVAFYDSDFLHSRVNSSDPAALGAHLIDA